MNYRRWWLELPYPWALYNKYMDVAKPQFLYTMSDEDQETFFQLVYLSE